MHLQTHGICQISECLPRQLQKNSLTKSCLLISWINHCNSMKGKYQCGSDAIATAMLFIAACTRGRKISSQHLFCIEIMDCLHIKHLNSCHIKAHSQSSQTNQQCTHKQVSISVLKGRFLRISTNISSGDKRTSNFHTCLMPKRYARIRSTAFGFIWVHCSMQEQTRARFCQRGLGVSQQNSGE